MTLSVPYTPELDQGWWVDRMPDSNGAMNVHARGVDTVSWMNAGNHWEEHAAYIGADGRIYDWRLIDGVLSGAPFMTISTPQAQIFTGHIAVSRRQDHVFIFATTVTGRLYTFEIDNWGVHVAPHATLVGVSATTMVTATAPLNGGYVRVFFSAGTTVYCRKFDGVAWTNRSFAGPPGPPPASPAPCALAAATEGSLGGTSYRTYLFCTRTGGTPYSSTLYYRTAPGYGNMDFGAQWRTKLAPNSVATTGFGLTARRRSEGGANTLEAFLLGASGTTNLFHIEHPANGALGGIDSLGPDGETTTRPGGIAAAGPDSRGYSDAFFVGRAGQATWLYRKINDSNGRGQPEEWSNYGGGQGWKSYAVGGSATEASAALFRGKVAIASMHGDFDEYPVVNVLWSENEDTFTGPTPIPFPPSPVGLTNDSHVDPVLDFADTGTAFIVALSGSSDGGGNGIYLWTTSNGTNFTLVSGGPLQFSVDGSGCDHPWLSVYRNPGGVDELHVVWTCEPGDHFSYTHAPTNSLQLLVPNIQTVSVPGANHFIPRLTVSQLDGSASIVWPHGICRNPVAGECSAFHVFGTNYQPDSAKDDGEVNGELAFDGTSQTVRAIRAFSAAASAADENVVHYAFQKRESEALENHGPMDVYYTTLTYNPATGDIDPGARLPLSGVDDGSIQTFPEITVTRDGPGSSPETLFVSWYDWADVTCVADGALREDRCYRVRGVAFFEETGEQEFLPVDHFPTVSDPALLPRRFDFPNSRFLGDYHAVAGDVLHSVHLAITAPVGGPDENTNVERGWVSHGSWNLYGDQ
jgi:hypothetical protein